MMVWVFAIYPGEGRFLNQSDQFGAELIARCKNWVFGFGGSMSSPLGAEKLRIEGCSMIEGVKIQIRRKRKDFF